MAQTCHLNNRAWRSGRGHRIHRTTKPLHGFCCAASMRPAMEQSRSHFGGAIVAKLAGSAKILKGERVHLVPLLGPGNNSGQAELPFGASLECICNTSASYPLVNAPPRRIGQGRPSGTTTKIADGSDAASPVSATSSRMLDVLYVLAGTGIVTTADGTVRKLHAGDSLVAWHNTCELRRVPVASAPDEQPPAVLRFHFPSSVIMLPPGAVVAPTPSHADLQVLVADCQGGEHDGELSDQEAAAMLSGVQQRAARAISQLYSQHEYHSQGVNGSPSGGDSPRNAAGAAVLDDGFRTEQARVKASSDQLLEDPVPRGGGGQVGSGGGMGNNILPVVGPFLHRLLRGAVAPAVGGAHLLRSALQRTPRRDDSGAPAAAPSAAATLAATPAATMQQQRRPGSGGCASLGPLLRQGGDTQPPAPSSSAPSGCVLLQRALEEFKAFRFPRQTNKLAFVFDPAELGLSLSFGVEVFEPGHRTPPHIHRAAHELFFVLAGEGVAVCNGVRFPVTAGDCVVFPPRAVHGIDNTSAAAKLYCLQLMTPNEAFVEHVKSGEAVGRLDDEDLCNLTARHC